MRIVLASISPHRKMLLARLQVPFTCAAPKTDETPIAGEPPDARAMRLSEQKARSLAGRHSRTLLIGGDQTICGDGTIFDKPGDAKTALRQLKMMRGRQTQFFTGVSVLDTRSGRMQTRLVTHTIRFRDFTDAEARRYIQKEPAFNCAGGAQVEGLGISLMSGIEGGDPTAIIGMPLSVLSEMLRKAGIKIP